MIDLTSGTFAYDDVVAVRLTAPIFRLQGSGVCTATGNAGGPAWRVRGKRATTAESDSAPGVRPV